MPSFRKDPDAVLDYSFDWSAWLDDDTIDSASVTAADGLEVDSTSNTTTVVTVWLSGGTAGVNYPVNCQIVTADGRTDERTITMHVRDR